MVRTNANANDNLMYVYPRLHFQAAYKSIANAAQEDPALYDAAKSTFSDATQPEDKSTLASFF